MENRISDLHDRMIGSIATANSADAILTPDPELKESGTATLW